MVLLQLVLFNVLRDSAPQIGTDLWVLHQMMQREDGVRDHIRVVMEAAHPAVIRVGRFLLVEDVGEILLPTDHLNLVCHEALVESHAHVPLQKVLALVREGCVGREETESYSELNIQAVFDIRLRETFECGQAGPEGRDSSHFTTELHLGDAHARKRELKMPFWLREGSSPFSTTSSL